MGELQATKEHREMMKRHGDYVQQYRRMVTAERLARSRVGFIITIDEASENIRAFARAVKEHNARDHSGLGLMPGDGPIV